MQPSWKSYTRLRWPRRSCSQRPSCASSPTIPGRITRKTPRLDLGRGMTTPGFKDDFASKKRGVGVPGGCSGALDRPEIPLSGRFELKRDFGSLRWSANPFLPIRVGSGGFCPDRCGEPSSWPSDQDDATGSGLPRTAPPSLQIRPPTRPLNQPSRSPAGVGIPAAVQRFQLGNPARRTSAVARPPVNGTVSTVPAEGGLRKPL